VCIAGSECRVCVQAGRVQCRGEWLPRPPHFALAIMMFSSQSEASTSLPGL